jgi:hypothetical protein
VDDDAGQRCPIKEADNDEDDAKEAVVASDRSFKKRRRVGGMQAVGMASVSLSID